MDSLGFVTFETHVAPSGLSSMCSHNHGFAPVATTCQPIRVKVRASGLQPPTLQPKQTTSARLSSSRRKDSRC